MVYRTFKNVKTKHMVETLIVNRVIARELPQLAKIP